MKMEEIFEIQFKDKSQLWCHIYNGGYVLGYLRNGIAREIFKKLETNELIQDFIRYRGLCPNQFCENGKIDIGYGEFLNCGLCNIF